MCSSVGSASFTTTGNPISAATRAASRHRRHTVPTRRMPYGTEQVAHPVGGQPLGLAAASVESRVRPGPRVQAAGPDPHHRLVDRHSSPLGVPHRPGQRRRRRLDGAIDGDARSTSGGLRGGAGSNQQDRLVGRDLPRLPHGGVQAGRVTEAGHDQQHQDDIHLARAQERADGGGQLVGRDVRAEVHRVARVDRAPEPLLQLGGERHHAQPLIVDEVHGQRAQPPGVHHDAHPQPLGQGLLREQERGLGQRRPGPAGDHPRLGQQRVDADADIGARAVVGPQEPGAGPASHDREQRLALGEATGRPGELQGVAERLEVQRGRGHPLVVHPRGEQVVARDVDPVAERDEGVDTETDVAREVQQREPHAARLGGHREPAGSRQLGQERRVEADRRVVGEGSLRVGADEPHTEAAGERQERGPVTRAPGRDARGHDQHGARAGGRGVPHDLRDPVGRHRHDHQIDRTLRERGQAPAPARSRRLRRSPRPRGAPRGAHRRTTRPGSPGARASP